MSNWGVQGSNQRQTEYATPRRFVQPIAEAIGGFDLDPASGAEESPHADATFTKDDDGLSKRWFGNVWLNPPFADKAEWLKKARREHLDEHTSLILALLPVDTSTGWFHEYVADAELVWFKEGRLAFDGASDWNPNFGVMLVIYGDPPDDLLRIMERRGVIYRRVTDHERTRQVALALGEEARNAGGRGE